MHRGRCVSQQAKYRHTAPLLLWLVPSSTLSSLGTLELPPPSPILGPSNDLVYTFFSLSCFESFLPRPTRLNPNPPNPPVMASRQPAGARPGAKFAQFKLVLLGRLSPL